MCDDCYDSTSTSDTSCDTSCDTSSSDTTSELPEDTGDLSNDGSEELPDDNSEEDIDTTDNTDKTEEPTDTTDNADVPEESDISEDGSDELPDGTETNDVPDEEPTDTTDNTDMSEESDISEDGSNELSDSTEISDIPDEESANTEDNNDANPDYQNSDKELFGFGKRDKTKDNIEYDDSPEAQELRDMGIKNVDLRDCKPDYRKDVVDSIKNMYDTYPELKDQLKSVRCYEMPNSGTYASYGPTKPNEEFGGCLNLNSAHFGTDGLYDKLKSDSEQGWLVPGGSPSGTVSHELGHGLHLDMCAKNNNLEYGKIPNQTDYQNAVREYCDNVHASEIVDQACNDCNIEFYSFGTAQQLSRYGASDKGEAFAEGISEANNSDNPRPLSIAINNRYKDYINRNGGIK